MQAGHPMVTKVVVWLGPASSSSHMASALLAETSLKHLEIEEWLPTGFKNPARSKNWRAIVDIASRDYWICAWIVQESSLLGPSLCVVGLAACEGQTTYISSTLSFTGTSC